MRFFIFTLGCKVNLCDSETIASRLISAGMDRCTKPEEADLIIINTCAVTAESERKSRNSIRHYISVNPEALIAVGGCWTRVGRREEICGEPDYIFFEQTDAEDAASFILAKLKERGFTPGEEGGQYREGIYRQSRIRASLKIQDGCNRYCTYCIIPYARGSLSSMDADLIRTSCDQLAGEGFKEVVLTGIHIASYSSAGRTLTDAVVEAAGSAILRIRLGSLEPAFVNEDFAVRTAATGKLCPHFHLSLQSGNTDVLRRMHRRYTREEYLESVRILRSHFPDATFTTDIIVGFPGESEEEFMDSVSIVEEVGFAHVHVFPFSSRKGTPAAKMPSQLTKAQKHERVLRLMEASEKTGAEIKKGLIGRTLNVLPEYVNSSGLYEGYSENYIRCAFASGIECINEIVPVKAKYLEGEILYCERV
ncbi:MAG: tRNA (N(6)-L-threonylcarbamoyladenosine(37)-C(2))-methylthiotransferase MtaB [Eubacteriales bacterium]|nr:tRNA (N(6)-L-threonylcarbamoyladenosine(37)-C(2))-methylthiotransferase MtaB [Eubacteriales bacterium]